MKIAIDASRAVRAQPTGTELYSARLIQYLAKIDTENTYTLYTPTPPPAYLENLGPNWQWKVIPFKRFWSQIRLSLQLFIDNPQLLIVPAHVLPLYTPKKTIVTLHDVAFEVFPEAYSRFALWYQRYAVRQAIARATAIITPSEMTKKDLVKIFHAPAHKMTVTHLGYDSDRFTANVELTNEIKKVQPYFLMLGRIETKKNTARVIEAFGQLKAQNPELKTKLVLLGKPGFGYEQIQAAKAALPADIATDILELGYASDDDVKRYMAGAIAFVYPSLYEGFGITLLEAMGAGKAIITSDISSIPEVVDDAAILVDPLSTDEIVHAMKICATDQLSRKQIIERAKERVRLFSWQKMAEETHAVIERVLKNEK